MRLYAGLALTCSWLLACASGPRTAVNTETYGRTDGGWVWVLGPWKGIYPSKDVDEVIDQLCPAVMKLPNAQRGAYGQEYCGAIYSLGDGTYYASHPSPLSRYVVGSPVKDKSCNPPRSVNDPRGHASILADYHSHPWPGPDKPDGRSFISREDLFESRQLWFIRIQFDTGCHVMKYIPYVGEPRPGEVYERVGGGWKLIGIVTPENKPSGKMTPPK
jgi:hypothetical protein